jgi:peroxiredoxin
MSGVSGTLMAGRFYHERLAGVYRLRQINYSGILKRKSSRSKGWTGTTPMKIDDTAPDFTLRDGEGQEWTLSDHRGKTVVLLFYPGDNTPVCTAQLCSVRDHWSEYQSTGAEVVGISSDTVESHKGFAEKNQLPLRLLSDKDGEVSAKYGMKSWLPGRSARGVVVVDKEGKIAYHKVQPLSLFRPKDDEVIGAIRKTL